MVVQFVAIRQRESADIAARFKSRAAELRHRVSVRIAENIVELSPVDTGTYIMAHAARAGPSSVDSEGELRSSAGKKRGRNPAQFRALALGNLLRSVSADALLNASSIWFRNLAEHAEYVEYIGWKDTRAYRVYAQTRAAVPQFIRDEAIQMGFQTR